MTTQPTPTFTPNFARQAGWELVPTKHHDNQLNVRNRRGAVVFSVPFDGLTVLDPYFQARRDQQLGRWRPEGFSNMVVYETGNSEGGVRVVDETCGTVSYWTRDTAIAAVGSHPAMIARDYYNNH